MSERHLDRIAALLAKAERTDSEHEAEALVEAAQRLAAKHSIDLEMAAARGLGGPPPQLEKSRLVFDEAQQNRNLKKHLVSLMSGVARSNDVMVDVLGGSTGVVLYGYPADLAATTALWASLSVQMVAEAAAWMRTGVWRSQTMVREGRWGLLEQVPMDARVARSSFYAGYVARIAERLAEARRAAETEADLEQPDSPVSTSVVLVAKRDRVKDFYDAQPLRRGRWQGSSSSAASAEAMVAGRSAASRANVERRRGVASQDRALGA